MPHIGNYEFDEIIGRGRFGRVYKGIHNSTGEYVAIKLEDKRDEHKLLEEAEFLKNIGKICNHVPEILQTGNSIRWNYMIMSFLGPNLEELFIYCGRNFSLKTTLLLTLQVLDTIKEVHASGIIHRDIKPDNFVMGFGETHNKLFLIDFGLAITYINSDMQHKEYEHKTQFTGTGRYSSLTNHQGIQQSRRDDLESIGYMLIYFLKGKLPWQNIPPLKPKNKMEKLQKLKNIHKKKESCDINELCEGCPSEFKQYIIYCRKLGYKEKPDYSYIRQLFRKVMKRHGYRNDKIFDWDTNNEEEKAEMVRRIQNIKNVKIQKAYKRLGNNTTPT
jgi:serine/threonine protein kinase